MSATPEPPGPSGPPGPSDPFGRRGADPATLPAEVRGLLEDVAAMARASAEDGLSMETLVGDLRLLCDLDDGERLPLDVLRVATLAWSDHHGELERRSAQRDGGVVAPDDLVWALVGRADRAPGSPHEVVVLRLAAPDPGSLLGDVAREVFDGADDLVALLADRHAVVLPDPTGDPTADPTADLAGRAALAVRALRRAVGPGIEADVTIVPLAPTAAAAAAGLRRLLVDLENENENESDGTVSPRPGDPPPRR
ncbi:hypothetical protein [Nocardioides zeae]|uniref:Uncharacterized protein n=1 Tax=Nocardioides zeae TaxID=1457234 RepID=A0AAJ1X3E6_9ACTN|nr:hypothetical protein [Nocardioides zeae]MDQ1105609.1 hypothetical protein [Nocardioides zeae]